MVDVSDKAWTRRRAVARCRVAVPEGSAPSPGGATDRQGAGGQGAEGWPELLEFARTAGIQAAKQTSRLIPLCHALHGVDVRVICSVAPGGVRVESQAEVTGPTGVEMEALTACAVAALTIVAGLGPDEPGVAVEDLALWEKSGGRSGTWRRP